MKTSKDAARSSRRSGPAPTPPPPEGAGPPNHRIKVIQRSVSKKWVVLFWSESAERWVGWRDPHFTREAAQFSADQLALNTGWAVGGNE